MQNNYNDNISYWTNRFKLTEVSHCGFNGGYPMFSFKRTEDMPLIYMKKGEIDRVIRHAEIRGGIELGVGYSLKKTAFISINNENIVICGHPLVIDQILSAVFK